MTIMLLKAHTIHGSKFPKGAKLHVSKRLAIELCNEEIAVSETDIPCEERQKKAARSKNKKTKAVKKDDKSLEDSEVNISNDL